MTKRKQPVDKPYGDGRYTKAAFFSFIRSALRQKSRRWPPIYSTLNAAKRPSKSKNKRLKWEYKCAGCKRWYPHTEVSVDHKEPAGTLRDYSDLPEFVRKLFCEREGLQVLCKDCHDKKTAEERKGKE